jgi:hypothetical protein
MTTETITKSERVIFKKNKETGDWEARPFSEFRYRIIKRWLKGYVLYFNDKYLASETRLNDCKRAAREHFGIASALRRISDI